MSGGMEKIANTCLLDTLAGRPAQRRPAWIMRQAGRYLPEYRRVRSQFKNFLDFCRSPDEVAEVTIQPVDRLDVDAAILFSDILVLLPPMGVDVVFEEGRGPVVADPVRSFGRISAMPAGNLNAELEYVFEGIRRTKKNLGGRVPLIGFAGGPFTVASYMVEGGSSKELVHLKSLLFTAPKEFAVLLGKLAEVTGEYLCEQARNGANVLTIMDSWAGFLSPEDYRDKVFPHTAAIIARVKKEYPDLPVIHYANGAPALVDQFVRLGADGLGLDWRSDLGAVLQQYPDKIFQGNMDPCRLFGSPEAVTEKVKALLALVGDRPHVYNLGHGILPATPVESARAFIDAVHG